MPDADAPSVLSCSHCGASFASRNALFKHLKAQCAPALAALAAPCKAPYPRFAICISYIGNGYFGMALNASEESTRPSVEGACLEAAKCSAWGADVVGISGEAVRTEKGASAIANIVLLTLARGATCVPDAESLRRELPPTIRLIGSPLPAPPAEHAIDLFKLVKMHEQVIAIPYRALARPSDGAPASDGAPSSDGAPGGAADMPSGDGAGFVRDEADGRPERVDSRSASICLLGLPARTVGSDVVELLCELGALDGAHGEEAAVSVEGGEQAAVECEGRESGHESGQNRCEGGQSSHGGRSGPSGPPSGGSFGGLREGHEWHTSGDSRTAKLCERIWSITVPACLNLSMRIRIWACSSAAGAYLSK